MNIIKLDAIDSTNDFLKKIAVNSEVSNWTVVTANSQTNGKGQMGAKWHSDAGKNLTVSILVKDTLTDIDQVFELNIAIALSIYEVLIQNSIPNLSIKWPNDIMSGNNKISGILIENIFKSDKSILSIVGFGLNVNQINFDNLPKVTSLKNICNKDFDLDYLLKEILQVFESKIGMIISNNSEILWKDYQNLIFKKGILMPFEDLNNKKFMGIIQEVTPYGKLKLLLEDDIFKEFAIKELTMLY